MSDEKNDIFSRIYGNNSEPSNTNVSMTFNGLEEENQTNMAMALILSIIGVVVSAFVLVCLVLAFSYDLCIFLDKYYIYIAVVIALVLLYSMYVSFISLKHKKKIIVSIFNMIICFLALAIVVVPFIFGLIYFQ